MSVTVQPMPAAAMMYTVQAPPDAVPGKGVTVNTPDGHPIQVTVPPGVAPGGSFQVQAQGAQQYAAQQQQGQPGSKECGQLLLAGEQPNYRITIPITFCMCIPIGEHKLSLTNSRLLAQKSDFCSAGGERASVALNHVTMGVIAKGQPRWSLVYFFAFLTFLSLFNFSWVSFLWFALFVIFYLLRPPAIKFGIDNNPDVGPNNMFDASGNICTMCCNTESNTAHMLNHYAIQKQHAV